MKEQSHINPQRDIRSASKARDGSIDALRGFLILLVVIGHFPANMFLASIPSWWSRLNECIYLVHVPVFFAIACLFPPQIAPKAILKSLLQALFPYIVWYCIFQYDLLRMNPPLALKLMATGSFESLKSILWFLPALACFRVLAAAFPSIDSSRSFLIGVLGAWLIYFSFNTSIVAAHPVIPFGIDIALYLVPLTLAFRYIHSRAGELRVNTWAAWFLFLGLIFLMYSVEPLKTHTQWHKRIDLAQMSVPMNLLNYGLWTAVCCSTIFLFLHARVRFLEFFGQYSLPIFLLHYEVFKFFFAKPVFGLGKGIALGLCVVTLSILLPVSISWLARRLSPNVRYLGL